MWYFFRPSTERVYWLLLTLTKDKNKNHKQKSTSTRMHVWRDHGFVIGIKINKYILKAKRFFFKGPCSNRIVQWINKSNHDPIPGGMSLLDQRSSACWPMLLYFSKHCCPPNTADSAIFIICLKTSTWYNACDHKEKNMTQCAFGKLVEWNNNRFLNFLLHYWVLFFFFFRVNWYCWRYCSLSLFN